MTPWDRSTLSERICFEFAVRFVGLLAVEWLSRKLLKLA